MHFASPLLFYSNHVIASVAWQSPRTSIGSAYEIAASLPLLAMTLSVR